MKYFIAPRSGEKSYTNFQSTIKHGVPFRRIANFLTEEGKNVLSKEEVIYSWGNREGKSAQWDKIQNGDIVIFYARYNFVMAGTVIFKQLSRELALAMWPPDEKGNPWEYTFFLNNLHYFRIPMQYFNEISGYHFRSVQGFQEILDPHLQLIKQRYPALDSLFLQFKDETSVEIPKRKDAVYVNVPTEVKPEYVVDFRLKQYEEKSVANDKVAKKNIVIDFDERHKRNALTGSRGEEIVLKNETDFLTKAGRPDLANKVKRVSVDEMSAGYDILSFDKNGNEKKIEVKSTTLLKGSNFSFRISSNEKKVAEGCANYWIYLVFGVNTTNPKIASIKNPFALKGFLRVIPIQYLVKGQIE